MDPSITTDIAITKDKQSNVQTSPDIVITKSKQSNVHSVPTILQPKTQNMETNTDLVAVSLLLPSILLFITIFGTW
jgi:hypothetical protein